MTRTLDSPKNFYKCELTVYNIATDNHEAV